MVAMRTKTQHNRRVTFKGGPLDGQTKIRSITGRWPAYLAEDGETPVRAVEGDRIMRRVKPGIGCYRHTERPDLSTMPVTMHHTYVHSSIPRGQDHS